MHKIICVIGLLLLAGSVRATLPAGEAQALADTLTAWPILGTFGWVSGSEADACEQLWMGIACDAANSTVIGLWLSGTQLNGTIPDSLAQLPQLSSLQLDHCNLNDAIPSSLETLSNLAVLNLASNSLTGVVPTGVVALTYQHLSDLNLANNQLELCGNADLNSTSVSPGILQCDVAGQVPTPCGCSGIWTHCLIVDIENCTEPAVPTPETSEPQTSAPESAEPQATVPQAEVPQAEVPQADTTPSVSEPTTTLPPTDTVPIATGVPTTTLPPTTVITPQAEPTADIPPQATTPTGNAPPVAQPASASMTTLSTLAVAALAALVLAAN